MELIKIIDLEKDYSNGSIITPVLKKLNLLIEKGDFSALAGPSGSGKTTLLNMIGCLDKCTGGEIYIDGQNIVNKNKKELCAFRKNTMGFVFQAYNLIPVLTAFENIEYPLVLKNLSKSERKERVEEILEQVELKDLGGRRPNQLSGGQQQRISIARALVGKPKIVLADEPTANLDSKTGGQIIELIRNINEKYGTTFLFSTHDFRIINFSKKIIHLEDGKIVKIAAPAK